jgi:hypothetical protein
MWVFAMVAALQGAPTMEPLEQIILTRKNERIVFILDQYNALEKWYQHDKLDDINDSVKIVVRSWLHRIVNRYFTILCSSSNHSTARAEAERDDDFTNLFFNGGFTKEEGVS